MNPSTALARTLVDELVRGGVREAVLAPGSRSAPLAIALAEADERGELRLHVRIDERSASYLALGLARASGVPVPVVCTSGTAAAIFHGAVLEASASGVPLLVLTADRPAELRGTGANQTIDQLHLYGRAPRWFAEVGAPDQPREAYWRSLTARALLTAADPRDPGPVHLNLAFREPLVPDADQPLPDDVAGGAPTSAAGPPVTDAAQPRPAGGTATTHASTAPGNVAEIRADRSADTARTTRQRTPADALDLADLPILGGRGVVLVGDGARDPRAALELAEALGWPVLSEPSGNARRGPNAIAAYPLLLADPDFAAAHRPDVVLTVGRVTLSRSVLAMVAGAGLHAAVDPTRAWADPTRTVDLLLETVPAPGPNPQRAPEGWLASWREDDAAAQRTFAQALPADELTEPAIARDLAAALPDDGLLFVGSSRPGRDLEAFSAVRPSGDRSRTLANRGVAGIDGLVSSAIGAALAHQGGGGGPAYALLGDLSLLHDVNGLLIGPGEPRPDLTIVVVDNDGGGIFGTLPPASQPAFERVFATPHGLDLDDVVRCHGVEAQRVSTRAELTAALKLRSGLRVLLARTDRGANADLLRELQRRVKAALSP